MLIERNQVIVGLVAIVVIGIATVFAVGSTGGLFVPGHEVTAVFEDAAGLKSGDYVYVAGVRTGRVMGVDIEGEHVRVTMKVAHDGVPADSHAIITLQNALGRRQVKLERPGGADPGPNAQYLQDGDEIPLNRTLTPIDIPELGDRSAELFGGLDTSKLDALASSLADVLEGKQEEVGELLEALDAVTAVIAEQRDELAIVLDRAETLIDAAAEKDQQIVTIVDRFGSTLNRLAVRRADIVRLLQQTARATTVGADLVEDRKEQLDAILTELHEDLAIVDEHQVQLADFVAILGVGFEGFAGIGRTGRSETGEWANVFTYSLAEPASVVGLSDCGGLVDTVLSALVGPDPQCTGSSSAGAGAASLGYGPLSAWFRLPGGVQP